MRSVVPVVAVILATLPAPASPPGQPLDCSDWVILVPGLSCTDFVDCDSFPEWNFCLREGSGDTPTSYDNEGRLLTVRETELGGCPGTSAKRRRVELVWTTDGLSWNTIAYVDGRCSPPAGLDGGGSHGLYFDDKTGRMLLVMQVYASSPSTYNKYVAVAIDGFATTFEILQTYTPDAGPISFRVPYMPEGFPAAAYFDTYYGDLATVGDWSQAQPLQCGYPATAPGVGDYFTVADPLPNPAPGHGRYYVTAVNYQGQRRYGRKSSGGVLSGRDPAVLPACAP